MAFGLPGTPKPKPSEQPAAPPPAPKAPAPPPPPPPPKPTPPRQAAPPPAAPPTPVAPPTPAPEPARLATSAPAPAPPAPAPAPAPSPAIVHTSAPPAAPRPAPPPPRPQIAAPAELPADGSAKKARRTIGLSVGISVISALAIWGLLGFLTTYFQIRPWDVTFSRQFTLAGETVKLLRRVNQPLRIYALFPNRKNDPMMMVLPEIEALVEEFRVEARSIELRRIDPDRDPGAYRDLVERLKLDPRKAAFGLAVEYGTRARLIPRDQLAQFEQIKDRNTSTIREKSFLGEVALTNAILNLVEDAAPKVDFTAGHGELDPEDIGGNGFFYARDALIYDKFEVRQRFLLEKGKIPTDTTVLVIAGPIEPFDPTEIAKIAEFLERGGGLLILAEPRRYMGLESLLAKYRIEFGNDIVVDPTQKAVSTSPTTILAEAKVQHPIVNPLEGSRVRMATNRSVRKMPTTNSDPPGLIRTELLLTSPSSWADTNLSSSDWKKEVDKGDTAGPIALAMSAQIPSDSARPDVASRGGIRIVAIGSRESFANECIRRSLANEDLFRSCVNWLANRDRVAGARPRSPDYRPLHLTEQEAQRMTLAAYGIPSGLFLLIGLLIWWRRRR